MASESEGQVSATGVCVNSSDDTENTASCATEGELGVNDADLASENQEMGNEADVSEFDFSTKSWKEDLTLIVDGKHLHVSSTLLAYISPVFSTMFEEKFATDGPREIQVSGHQQFSHFLEFLRCIYPTVRKRVTLENVFVVLPLIKMYKVTKLAKHCERVLVNSLDEDQTPKNLCMLAREASTYCMKQLRDKCVALAAKVEKAGLREAERKFPLPLDIKFEILEERLDLLSNNIESLQSRCDTLENENANLKEMVKALWSNTGGCLAMINDKVGMIRLDLKKPEDFRCFSSLPVDLNGLRWSIEVSKKAYNEGGYNLWFDYLEVSITADIIGQHKDWSCQFETKLRILKRDKTNNHYWKDMSGTVNESNTRLTFERIIKMSQLWSEEFAVNDEITIESFILTKKLFVVL